jgi:pimeloyl-ACP methyl ester carboxylesterase
MSATSRRRPAAGLRRLAAVLVPLLAVALAAPAAQGAAGSRGSTARSARPAARRIAWTACGTRLQCAKVRVPLNWSRPAGPTISLAVIRHLASRRAQRIGSLFLNPGGPGDSGVGTVTERGDSLDAETGGRFDVVSWDPRGSGASAPVSCFVTPAARARFWDGLLVPTTATDGRRYLAKTRAFARRCGARNGRLLAHITTADTVRDLERLRRLVGDRRLTFLGESTGTLIGQTYANLFPRRVRAIALDGVDDPARYTAGTAEALTQSLTDVDRLFAKFMALCQASGPARCALAGHGPVAPRVERLLARLRRGSIPAPSAMRPGRLTYGTALAVIKLYGLPDASQWPDLARQLDAAAAGDGSLLKSTADLLAGEDTRRGLEFGQAILCADSPARQRGRAWTRAIARLRRVSAIGGAVMGWLIGAPCASWTTRGADRYTGPWTATTRNPILVVGTRLDPNTPLANARRAARRLGNAVLLTHEGYGHLSIRDPSTCVQRAIGRYLVRLATPRRGTVCPSDRLPFDPAFGQPLP